MSGHNRLPATEREAYLAERGLYYRKKMGLPLPDVGTRSGDGMVASGLGVVTMAKLMYNAREIVKLMNKRDRSKPSTRKPGGQPGNRNAGGGKTKKLGVYANGMPIEKFEERFNHFSTALGRADAKEEVALTRAMLMNILKGYDPLGGEKIEEPELLNGYMRDVMMLNIKAQELYLKQETRKLEQQEKAGAKAGIEIRMSAEMEGALASMGEAQADYGAVSAESMASGSGESDKKEQEESLIGSP